MILREATIRYSGNDPNLLKPKSNKRICISCDKCGRVRWGVKSRCKLLCKSCSNKIKNQPPKPKFVQEEDRFIPNTGIDRILTIKKFGYDPVDLKINSIKRVITKCQKCKSLREVRFGAATNLCGSCSKKGKYFTNEHKNNLSKNRANIIGKNNPMYGVKGKDAPGWKGGISGIRNHVKHERDCIKLNDRFKGCEGHHITSGIIVYIPKYIHRSVYHNMKNGKGMKEINKLALNYLISGDY